MASISLSHITKTYASGGHALSDVSFDIADGEQVVIVGPSGCGKSTLLRLVAGLEEITSGTIRVDGKDITHLAPKDRDVAMVFQDYALYPHLTVRRNLGYALKLRGVPAAERDRRVEAVAAILGLTPLLERRPGMLSGGQKQRVALGRAIVREPLVFLMDEPLSNLDAKLRIQMRGEISRLHDRLRTTTMFVTHDQAEAMTLADRIVVLRDGTIQQIATPDVMYDAPANAFVAGFIGSPAMNFQAATLEGGDSLTLRWRGLALPIAGHQGLAAYAGRGVLFGVRPEHIGATAAEANATGAIETIENMGNERFLFVRLDGTNAEARDEAPLMVTREAGVHRLQRGERVALTLETQHLHFFDPATDARIGPGSSPTS